MPLETISISHRFKRQAVLHDVTLSVQQGDCYGLLGHNGAGKTTLLRTILGLLNPMDGTITIDGFDIRTYPCEARVRMGGLVESPGFHESWNGVRNLQVLARLQGFDRAGARAEAERVLALVGLDKHEGITPHKRVRDYSQGMKQRLGIAQALIGRPAYLVLDEPMNGLDPQAIVDIRTLIKRLTQQEQVTVIISSHQLAEIAGLCNRIAILRRGTLLVEDEVVHLLETDKRLYRLTVAAEATAVEADLRSLDLNPQIEQAHERDSRFVIDLGPRTPAQLTQALLDHHIDLLALTPCEPILEEVYLRLDRQAVDAQPSRRSTQASPVQGPPSQRLAPSRAWWRGLRYEWGRIASGAKVALLWLIPALVAGLSIAKLYHRVTADIDKVGQEVFSVTPMTAFDGMGQGLQVGLPLLMVLLAGLASQSIASEQSRGTLRYLLLRPLGRMQWVGAKYGALVLIALMGYVCLVASSLAASTYYFDFTDLAEVLPNGKQFPLVAKDEMMHYLWPLLWMPILPLLSYLALGFALGSWIKNSVVALTTTLGAILLIDLGRGFFTQERIIGWLPAAHLPSPLGGHGFVQFYRDVVQGVSNAVNPYGDQAILVSSVWVVGALVLAVVAMTRKAG